MISSAFVLKFQRGLSIGVLVRLIVGGLYQIHFAEIRKCLVETGYGCCGSSTTKRSIYLVEIGHSCCGTRS